MTPTSDFTEKALEIFGGSVLIMHINFDEWFSGVRSRLRELKIGGERLQDLDEVTALSAGVRILVRLLPYAPSSIPVAWIENAIEILSKAYHERSRNAHERN